jgi:hypothetical protein
MVPATEREDDRIHDLPLRASFVEPGRMGAFLDVGEVGW